ncbi:hypothetical protein ACKWTF_003253 [Chironomus riparius]
MFNDVECDICKFKFEDKALYGKFLRSKSVEFDAHHYCLLSGSDFPQKGTKKNPGLEGFLENDVIKAFSTIKDNKCIHCCGNHAAVKCAATGCDKTWHYPCGRHANCITQFIGEFKSYCSEHNPETNVLRHPGYVYCCVCFKFISSNNPASCIFSKCCAELPKYNPEISIKSIKFECFTHAACIQRYTVNAGYDSVCLNCNMNGMTKEEWQDYMRRRGIFIPKQMATWEDDEYFKKQTKNKCEHKNCKTPNVSKNVWTCFVCGCFPLHLKCAGVTSHDEYYCPKCYDQSFINLIPTTSNNIKK